MKRKVIILIKLKHVSYILTVVKPTNVVVRSCSRPYHFKFFKGCLLQILLGLFLNTLSRVSCCEKFRKIHRKTPISGYRFK